jgi:hypothetical protein
MALLSAPLVFTIGGLMILVVAGRGTEERFT